MYEHLTEYEAVCIAVAESAYERGGFSEDEWQDVRCPDCGYPCVEVGTTLSGAFVGICEFCGHKDDYRTFLKDPTVS